MIDFLLYFALTYLLFNSVVFYLNLKDLSPLLSADGIDGHPSPLVSICIPARNEAKTIARVLDSVLNQNYLNLEIWVLDDESTDNTSDILAEYQKNYSENLSILSGKPKPDSWLGKSWACHQLSQKARGKVLFFIDADVWLNPNCVQRVINSLYANKVDFVTVWPVQKMGSFWERAVIPLVYHGLFTLLPTRYVHHKPQWISPLLNKKIGHYFAAACGQCMVFKRTAYEAIGGHESVKKEIVEDVALARSIKINGFGIRMFHGKNSIWCRMYTSAEEMWNGFRKNFLALHNNSVLIFIGMAVVNFIVHILPFITLIAGLLHSDFEHIILSLLCIILIYAQRLILAYWYNWEKSSVVWHPLGILWFHILGIQVLQGHFFGRRAKWKNRPTD